MTPRGWGSKFESGVAWIREGGSWLSLLQKNVLRAPRGGALWLGLAWLGLASEVHPPSKSTKNHQKVDKKSPKIAKKSPKIEKMHPKAPKSAQERHKGRGNQVSPTLGAVLGRSWDALGTPRARPRPSKTQPRAPNFEPEAFFCTFFYIFFPYRFWHPFLEP